MDVVVASWFLSIQTYTNIISVFINSYNSAEREMDDEKKKI
jgi:hypothetical protein